MKHLMLVWIQWSGKWTQARNILEQYPDEFVLFEMGTQLRKFAKNGTPDGDIVNATLTAWNKVKLKYIVQLSEEFIQNNQGKRILIDGAIRDKEQNDAMEYVWWDFDVIHLDIDEKTALNRLAGRRIDPITQETFPWDFEWDINPKTGNTLVVRADDTEDAIKKRIAWSLSDTLPLLEVWKNHGHTVHTIDACGDEDHVFWQIQKIL